MENIKDLNPQVLWGYFYELTQIPRPSGFMGPIQDYMLKFGQSVGLKTWKDAAGNILIRKPATPGMENKPGIVLQSHLDMVPQKNSHIKHDFEKDPLEVSIVDGWVKANQTTLGADNGIGVASIMAIMASRNISHGPLEALFTVDEETGMYGAFGLKAGAFDGKILINLDSEHEGDLFVGCAGGVNLTAEFEYEKNVPVPEGDIAVKLNLAGLKGGHSGVDILLGRANANKLLFRFLKMAVAENEARLSSFSGGTLRNAIPREAMAIVTIPEDGLADLAEAVADYEDQINEEYKGLENPLSFTIDQVELPSGLIPEELQDDLINAIEAVHNGVLRMIPEMPDVVETSSNLAICESSEGLLSCRFLIRSAVESMKQTLVSSLESTFALAGAKVTLDGDYPGWKPNLHSPIMDILAAVYEKQCGVKPQVNVIHAGLECGIIQDAVGTLDMISFGPNISFPHSPDEKVEIASVERFWKCLVAVLAAV
jgi:aminoacyl-histidine dipeptidase